MALAPRSLVAAALSCPGPTISQRCVPLASPMAPVGVVVEEVLGHGWKQRMQWMAKRRERHQKKGGSAVRRRCWVVKMVVIET